MGHARDTGNATSARITHYPYSLPLRAVVGMIVQHRDRAIKLLREHDAARPWGNVSGDSDQQQIRVMLHAIGQSVGAADHERHVSAVSLPALRCAARVPWYRKALPRSSSATFTQPAGRAATNALTFRLEDALDRAPPRVRRLEGGELDARFARHAPRHTRQNPHRPIRHACGRSRRRGTSRRRGCRQRAARRPCGAAARAAAAPHSSSRL